MKFTKKLVKSARNQDTKSITVKMKKRENITFKCIGETEWYFFFFHRKISILIKVFELKELM